MLAFRYESRQERAVHNISIEQGLSALQRFVAREWQLALPLALAFLALPPLIVGLIVQPMLRGVTPTITAMRALGLTMPAWVTPLMFAAGLVTIIGAMALQALVLLPRISVAEAIVTALRRSPAWLGAAVILFGALFAVLIVVGILVSTLPSGASLLVIATLIGMIVAGICMIAIMPLIVDKGFGPVAALREGFAFYRGQIVRLIGGLFVFLAGAWVLGMAINVALGSVVLLVARLLGQPELGNTLVALLGALLSAVEWGTFYLLVACFYLQRTGRA